MGGRKKDMQAGHIDAVALVADVLNQAVACGASDVHFEPTSQGLVIRYRLDGRLKEIDRLPAMASEHVITRLKVLGHLLTYRSDIPQEGRIAVADVTAGPVRDGGRHHAGRTAGPERESATKAAGGGGADDAEVTDMRLAVFPTIHGQRAVVRIFYENRGLMHLEQLGLRDDIQETLKGIAAGREGVLLLTGPAGSGKSTTLAALLRYILEHHEGRSVVALEDPVERVIPGVTQVQVSATGALTFPVALRSLLRQDPEVLMLGEIRDAETARIAIEAGLTGHLLMSTLHSGSPAGALLRLLEMGIEPYQVTSAIRAVLNQRLVRRLCVQCRRQDDDGRWQAVGCEACLETGFHGRVLVAELVTLDGKLRRALLEGTDLDQLQQLLRRRGHMTLAQDAARLAAEGITTREEVANTIGNGADDPGTA